MKFNYVKRGNQIIEIKRYHGARMIARFSHVLYSFGGSFIPPGQYSFPFRFKTGEDYPASFMVLLARFRTNRRITTPREELNTSFRPSSGFPIESEPFAPNLKWSFERLLQSKTTSRRWKPMLNLAAASTRAQLIFVVSSKRTATPQGRRQRCTACSTTRREKQWWSV